MGGLFLWAGGRWCELDAATGRVRGWRQRPRFVYRSRGRLQLASTRSVLRGLKALVAGKPTTVRDGARLSQRRPKRRSPKKKALCSVCSHHNHCCAATHNNSCTNNNAEAPKGKHPAMVETGVQVTLPSRSQPDTQHHKQPVQTLAQPVQTLAQPDSQPIQSRSKPHTQPRSKPLASRSRPLRAPPRRRERSSSSEPEQVIQREVRADVHRSSSEEAPKTTTQDSELPLAQRTGRTRSGHTQSGRSQPGQSQAQSHCKELVINEDDVDMYRSYLIAHDPAFDAHRFDADEAYKLAVFFRINPLVSVERSARVERMLRSSRSSQEMSLKDFATKLGLRSISDREDSTSVSRYRMRSRAEKIVQELSSCDETDKENRITKVRQEYVSKMPKAKVIEESDDSETHHSVEIQRKPYPEPRKKLIQVQANKKKVPDKSVKGTGDEIVALSSAGSDSELVRSGPRHVVKKNVPVKKFPIKTGFPTTASTKRKWSSSKSRLQRDTYSSLEDHAIVAWLSVGARASHVNGNRCWLELQAQYQQITGHSRTWHSLRNRYLRYILPALTSMVAPEHAARLRAAAAHGQLKKKELVSRRHSLLQPAPVRSAFAAGRRQRPRDDSHTSPTDRRVLRSSGVQDPRPVPRDTRPAPRDTRPASDDSDSQPDKRQRDTDSSDSDDQRSRKKQRLQRGRQPHNDDNRDGSSDSVDSEDLFKDLKGKGLTQSFNRSANGRFKPDRSKHRRDRREQSERRNRSGDGLAKVLNRLDDKQRTGSAEQSNGRRNRSNNRRDRSDDRQRSRTESEDRRASLRKRRDDSDRDESPERRGLRSQDGSRDRRASRTPTYDQLTRQFAARLRSTPNELHANTQVKSQKTRKLYNPNAVLR